MSKKSSQPFARIGPGLYMGRRPPPDPRIGQVFDAVVLTAYEYQPKAGEYGRALVLHVPLDDMTGKPPTEHEKALACEAGKAVARWVKQGKRVLVTCRQGRNRSGWVTGSRSSNSACRSRGPSMRSAARAAMTRSKTRTSSRSCVATAATPPRGRQGEPSPVFDPAGTPAASSV